MKRTTRIFFPILALCLLGGALCLTMVLISPPAPLPVDAPATSFSAGRAMQDLGVIAREPHPMGISLAHAEVRDYLLGEIRKLGLEPQVQDTFGIRVVNPGFVLSGSVENILVRLPGTDPAGAILLMSHYDSTPGGPGGADSGSGVVTILEVLRALHAGPPLRQDVIVMFTDGEEPGTIGAHAFVAQHPWLEDVKLVMNTDQFLTGTPLLIRASQGNGLWIKALARNAPSTRPAYVSLPFHLFAGGDTDLLPFTLAGLPGADIQTIASAPEIHTALDFPRIVHPGSVQQAGNQMLALVRTLGNLPTLENTAPDQTFFPVLGRLIHYPTDWAAPLAILAGLCFLATIVYGLRKRALTRKGMGLGFLAYVIYLALGVGIASLLWLGIQALHPEYAYSAVRQHLSDDALYALGLFFVVLAVASSTIAVARKKIAALDLAAGALVVWFPATAAATIFVPATSYLVTWVLLIGSLALLLALAAQSGRHAWVRSGVGFTISAILLVFLWAPVVYQTFLGSSFPMLWMMVGLAAAWLGAMLPVLDWITSPKRWLLPAAAALVALSLLVAGHVLVGRDSPPPLVNSIGYWLNADSKQANWVAFIGGSRTDARTSARYQVAFPEKMDERQSQLLATPVWRPYTELFQAAPPFSVLTSDAPLLAADGPGLEVIADEWVGDRRVVQARIITSLHDRVYVIAPSGSSLLAITVPNNEKTELPPVDGREWVLRFDGTPLEGIDISFDFSTAGPIQFLVVEEKTGLPSFPGLATQPEPGTMRSPGEFYQGDATDFMAIYRKFVLPELTVSKR